MKTTFETVKAGCGLDPEPPNLAPTATRLTLLGPTRAQNLTILSSAIPEKFKGV